jgi:hypothetical protein
MPDAKNATNLADRAFNLFTNTFETLWSADGQQDAWHWVLLALIVIVVGGTITAVIFKAMGKVVEHLIKLVEAYKGSGLPVWLNLDNKYKVRRRKQFCAVLDADLAYLAKAENWNDQYFTDLEAEVETEGGYYASAWDKTRRKKSFGLRKEPSLIKAITSSAERAMQLVGEPGSGKSVALRHLAKQLAEQGKKSNDKNATVPLYINLREMDPRYLNKVSADDVREFVLDNIRRGDADTSAFVKENWGDYCNRGIWLFLFDSFDEIPAVLHSEAGSDVIRKYSQAIRQFLEGMGECKGILASREFKGPEALPWKKLRVLPLSGEKQDELIQNSFLAGQQMSLVRQHLANSDSSIGATPLFLTLLCRFVRDEGRAPTNDHDILLQHIERLARREPEYLKRKYSLTAEGLVSGAERLAQLFAEDETLSLAPTLDQILTSLRTNAVTEGNLENLISALVDCKIGRADVPNAAHGDRRFAFAHRRYQEALFVRYLAHHPDALAASELLTEPRWREYAVTLLQTRDRKEIENLLDAACVLLENRADLQTSVESSKLQLSMHTNFFNWTDEVAVQLLSLLQEGLARRLEDVPQLLSNAVYKFLSPRWEGGDTFDRCEVLRLGGLLPSSVLITYLVESFAHGTEAERTLAFRQAAFTSKLPEPAKLAVLEMLSDQTLLAKDRADQLSLEALAARLPKNIGADFVIARGSKIRRNLRWINVIGGISRVMYPKQFMRRTLETLKAPRFSILNLFGENRNSIPSISDLTFPFMPILFVFITAIENLLREPTSSRWMIFTLALLGVVGYIKVLCPYIVRSYGNQVTCVYIFKLLSKNITSSTFILSAIGVPLMFFVLIVVGWPLGYLIDFVLKTYYCTIFPDIDHSSFWYLGVLGGGAVILLIEIAMIPVIIFSVYNSRKLQKNWVAELQAAKKVENSELSILVSAGSIDEVLAWLNNDDEFLIDIEKIRCSSSFVLQWFRSVISNPDIDYTSLPKCLRSDKKNELKIKKTRQALEYRFNSSII